ncbi:MAG: hypothetical protein ABI874_09855 [Chloroflexota bacterium]
MKSFLVLLLLALLPSACATPDALPTSTPIAPTLVTTTPRGTATNPAAPPRAPSPTPAPRPSPPPTPACAPTNQDDYVYLSFRLEVLAPCIRVSGVVKSAFVNTSDGDGLIDLAPDEPFKRYLKPGNMQTMNGNLHLEIVCYGKRPYTQSGVDAVCADNPNPVRDPLPKVGQRIWAEGRWVIDLVHDDIAELHPLYRWSLFK